MGNGRGPGGILNGYGVLGNEYKGSVWDVMNAVKGDHVAPLLAMLQRLQEIKPNYKMAQLVALLSRTEFTPESRGRYFIFPVYRTVDRTDPTIVIQPANGTLPAWIIVSEPDGSPTNVGFEPKQVDKPNTNYQTIVGGNSLVGRYWTEESGTLSWKPGSGFDQCLGEFRVSRLVDCYFIEPPL